MIHNLQPGGAEHVLLDLAQLAPPAGIELSVVSVMGTDFPYRERLEHLGVPVATLGLQRRWDPRALTRAVAVIGRTSPGVVHTHLKHADLVGAYAARRLGVPLVSTLHLIEDATSGLARVKRAAGAQARNRYADRIVAVSGELGRWYLNTFRVDPTRVRTIHNGVVRPPVLTPDERDAVRRSLGAGPQDVLATMIGVMRPGKGHRELLDALRRIPTDVPLRVVLAGDGELRPMIDALAAGPALKGRVGLLGYRDDVDALTAACDFVIHPSRFDALPTALIHALANGRPSVASAVGGIPEIVTPGEAVLVPPGDVVALATALERMTRDAGLRDRLGRAAQARFDAEFDGALWVRRLRSLYDEIVPSTVA